MKKILYLLVISLAVISCTKKSDDTTTSQYSNKLTFGTGLNQSNPFELTGTGTNFPVSGLVYFRLESSDDMGGSKVRIRITKPDGTEFETPPDFDNPQSYGHIFISGFSVPSVAGTYTATGILVTGTKTIATSPLTTH